MKKCTNRNFSVVVKTIVVALGALWTLIACQSDEQSERVEFGGTRQALSQETADALGFESAIADWTASSSLSSSTQSSAGNGGVALTVNGWTQLYSKPLSSVAPVGSVARLDIFIPEPTAWGEVRLILELPSQGIGWADLGGHALAALSAGSFTTVQFPIEPSLRDALNAEYSDLTVRIVVNGPAATEPYLLDNLDFGLGTTPDTDEPVTAGDFRIALPAGLNPQHIALCPPAES